VGDCLLMRQFWHQGQSKLHESDPAVRVYDPGWKWYSGFFSMGLKEREETNPYVSVWIAAPRFWRVRHHPTCPSPSTQRRSQVKH
jgi:hypothetical protein